MNIKDVTIALPGQHLGSPRSLEQEQTARATVKWNEILKDFEGYSTRSPGRLRDQLRQGVPAVLRPAIWREITKTSEFKSKFGSGVYDKLVRLPCPFADVIELDLHRTFPNHSLFCDKNGHGQTSLRNVMIAYSNYDAYVGYCQGMSFLAGLLLMLLSEEDTFYALVQIMNMHKLRATYQPGLPGLSLHLKELNYQLRFVMPDLATHLDAEGVQLEMFAPTWVITIFVYQFPLPLVLRIWDVFLYEGMEVVFRVALAVLKLSRATLLRMDFEDILTYLKRLPDEILDPNRLLLCALNMSIDKEHLDKFFFTYNQAIPSSLRDRPSAAPAQTKSEWAGVKDVGESVLAFGFDVLTFPLRFMPQNGSSHAK